VREQADGAEIDAADDDSLGWGHGHGSTSGEHCGGKLLEDRHLILPDWW
jgi:hypothetical protein